MKGSRRLNADDPRYADLPIVALNGTTGEIDVIRGPFTLTPEFAHARTWLADMPDHPHIVLTSRRGRVFVWPISSFVSADDRDDPRATTSWIMPSLRNCANLAEAVASLRAAADEVEALAADGWTLDAAMDTDLVLRDTMFHAKGAALRRRSFRVPI